MDGEKLRDGIFALRTRRFGSVAECMVKRLLKCSLARSLFHDLYDDALHHRIEVKEIKENSRGGRIYYSDFQHKGNEGEGQFHINPSTFQIHLDHYHYKTLTYDELYQLLAAES